MAKKPDLSGVKTFFFNYGERVALGACVAVALLLVVWGLSGATGPATPWDAQLKQAAQGLQQRIPPAPDLSAEDQKKLLAQVKAPPVGWDPFDTNATPGPYQNSNELLNTQRNNPLVFNVLPGDENFQMDYICRGWQRYEIDVRNNTVLAVKEEGGDKKGPGAGGATTGFPMAPGGMPGGATSGGPSLAHVLQPRHMLVVTGIFPMKKQVDEFVKALRLRDVSELRRPRIAHRCRHQRVPRGIQPRRQADAP